MKAKSVLLAILFIVSITQCCEDTSAAAGFPQDVPSPLKQGTTRRTWREVTFDTVFSISAYQGKPILNSGRIKVDPQGRIYVLDMSEIAVLKFSGTGEYLARYGKGKGRGPGEFQLPVDYSFSSSGDVFVADANSALVTLFGENGNVKGTVRTQGIPNRIAWMAKDQFVIMQIGSKGGLFHRLSANGKHVSSFGTFFPEQEYYGLPINMTLTASNNKLIGAFEKGGQLFCFKDDSLIFFRESVDGLSIPKYEILQNFEGDKKTTIIKPSEASIHSYRELSVSQSHIFVLAQDASLKLGKVIIDVYDENNGDYIFSFRISKLPSTESIVSIYFAIPFFYTCEFLKDGSEVIRKYQFRYVQN